MASTQPKTDSKTAEPKPDQTTTEQQQTKSTTALEEDDEFEDFPVDDWQPEDTEAAATGAEGGKHLWEESWDDDDTNDDFSNQLKEELKKVEASKRR